MKSIFDQISFECSKNVTKAYSTSFSSAVKMLAPSIRQDIYNIYGFVRFADEIVDTFHDYNKEQLFSLFEDDLQCGFRHKISLKSGFEFFSTYRNKYDIPKN
jgi:15-cis-phytoene synthase